MNENNNICKKCGGEMIPVIEDSVQGLKCIQCGEWGYMTTYIAEIQTDNTIYSIYLLLDNPITLQTVKSVALVSGCNYLKAKELMSKINSKILEGTVETVLKAVDILKMSGIKYKIFPDFKYDNE